MSRRARMPLVLPLALQRDGHAPMHRQLYEQLRELILSGRVAGGSKLPSTRSLAEDLDVSRNTVAGAFEQLFAEGYLEGKVGSGSYVSNELPEEALSARKEQQTRPHHPRQRGLSQRGERLARLRRARGLQARAFTAGLPDLDHFPFDVWSRLMAKAWRRPPIELLANTEPAGYMPLRQAIADYLRAARAVRCEAAQVIIVSGAQHAIGLAAHVLLDDGDAAMIEEPGYAGVRGALVAAGARLCNVPVDQEGLDISIGEALEPQARLVCVAPSHQYPLGCTMSLPRRLALLDWAARKDAWIIEDDYDSEYRYAGKPLSSLQGLDNDDRVVYVGSFSKVMFPSLRLGYLVVPPDLVEPFRQARAALDDHPSTIAQPALTQFIEDGHFSAHIRRMRKNYQDRQAALVDAFHTHLSGLLTIQPSDAGMHMPAFLTEKLAKRMTDQGVVDKAARAGLTLAALSSLYQGNSTRQQQGVLLGFAAIPVEDMEKYVIRLREALEV